MGKRGPKVERVLFIDADFFDHPKITALTRTEREQWLRLLADQLRTGNGSDLPPHAYGVPRKRLERYLELGLLDQEDDVLCVHNWERWNGREAYKRFLNRERVRRHRARRRAEM